MEQQNCILIVDDEKVIRNVIAEVLEKRGLCARAVGSPTEALGACENTAFDLALVDLKMPGPMDGIDLLGKLSQDYPDIVVIIMTGYGTLDSAIAALRKGAYDYLTKPVDIPELIESVERGLHKRREGLRHRQLIANLAVTIQELDGRESGGREAESVQAVAPPPTSASTGVSTWDKRVTTASNLTLDLRKRIVLQGDKRLELTATEFDLLEYLISHSDRIVTARELVKALRGYDVEEVDARPMVRVQIQRLRRKLHDDAERSRYLLNVRGKGYRFIR